MANIILPKHYDQSLFYSESYRKSSKKRNEELQLLRNYRRALKKETE